MIVLPFYGCVLNPVLGKLTSDGRMILTTSTVGFDGAVYTTAEALQRLRFCRGDVDIPRRLRDYCNLPTNVDPVADNLRRFESADMVLVEPHTSLDFFFGPYALHRGSILTCLLNRLGDVSEEIDSAVNAWFYKGMLAQDREIQREAASVLLPVLAGRVEDEYIARRVLVEGRGARQSLDDYVASIAELRDIIGLPMGIVTYVYQFLPDGRPMAWPADFHENTLEAAKRLNVPIFDSAMLVKQYGVATTHDETRQFYRADFEPIAAEALIEFCNGVLDRPAANAKIDRPAGAVRANLFAEKRAFSSDGWNAVRASFADDASIDPVPAGLVAVKLVEERTPPNSNDAKSHDVRRGFSGDAVAGDYTMSFFACPAERKTIRMLLGPGDLRNRAEASFDLIRGLASIIPAAETGVGAVRVGMVPAIGGWWWCWLTARFEPAESMTVEIGLCNGLAENYYRGDGQSGAWIAGPRLERGSQPLLDLNERSDGAVPRDGAADADVALPAAGETEKRAGYLTRLRVSRAERMSAKRASPL